MSEHKALRIGLVGCGFMGRTHSNGYKRVGDFFPELEYRPVLKAVCSRSEDNVQAFAEQWGYESLKPTGKRLLPVMISTRSIFARPMTRTKKLPLLQPRRVKWCFAKNLYPERYRKGNAWLMS